MVIKRIELCINLVRLAIQFVMIVAETVVIIQQRSSESSNTLTRAKQNNDSTINDYNYCGGKPVSHLQMNGSVELGVQQKIVINTNRCSDIGLSSSVVAVAIVEGERLRPSRQKKIRKADKRQEASVLRRRRR